MDMFWLMMVDVFKSYPSAKDQRISSANTFESMIFRTFQVGDM